MSTAVPNPSMCAGTPSGGQPCKGRPLTGSPFCWAHDPALRVSPGGAYRPAVLPPSARRRTHPLRVPPGMEANSTLPPYLAAVQRKLLDLIVRVENGRVPPRVGEVVATLAGKLIDIEKFSLDHAESREFSRRLAQLEGLLDETQNQRVV